MTGASREDFLAAVRQRLGVARRSDVPPLEVNLNLARHRQPEESPVRRFGREAAGRGLHVHWSVDERLAADLAALVRRCGAKRAGVSAAAGITRAAIGTALEAAGVAVLEGDGFGRHFDADVGITDVVAAVAETGSLVVSSDDGRSRGAFIAPPTHIAVVPEARIVDDLLDLWPRLRERGADRMPAALVLVSGPSKTADIEGILVTGVHGPGEVHVVIVEDA